MSNMMVFICLLFTAYFIAVFIAEIVLRISDRSEFDIIRVSRQLPIAYPLSYLMNRHYVIRYLGISKQNPKYVNNLMEIKHNHQVDETRLILAGDYFCFWIYFESKEEELKFILKYSAVSGRDINFTVVSRYIWDMSA